MPQQVKPYQRRKKVPKLLREFYERIGLEPKTAVRGHVRRDRRKK